MSSRHALPGCHGVAVGLSTAGLLDLALVAPSMWTVVQSAGHSFPVSDAPSRDVAVLFGAEVYADGKPSPYLPCQAGPWCTPCGRREGKGTAHPEPATVARRLSRCCRAGAGSIADFNPAGRHPGQPRVPLAGGPSVVRRV